MPVTLVIYPENNDGVGNLDTSETLTRTFTRINIARMGRNNPYYLLPRPGCND